jgi:Initiator Replication protein
MSQKQEVKKHVGAVHINNRLTLLQRKLANVLLLNAYDNLLTWEVHSIRLTTLCDMVGFESNDYRTLKEALQALASTVLEWNILDDRGEREWGVSSMLAQAVIRKGVCTYAYSTVLRGKLYNPEIYARINLSIQRKFSSGHTLALYENCTRFRSVGTTGWIDVGTLRKLLGVANSHHYEVFKNFNREVLKRAVKEVNETSDILLSVEYRKERRTVVALRFSIRTNPQFSLILAPSKEQELHVASPSLENEVIPEHPLRERLLDFGLTRKQVDQLLISFEGQYIEEILSLVKRDFLAGRVEKLPAYTFAAIKEDYRPRKTPYELQREAQNELRLAQRRRFEEIMCTIDRLRAEYEKEVLNHALQHLPSAERIALEHDFVRERGRDVIIARFYRKAGFDHPVVKGAFLAFAKQRLITDEAKAELCAFASARGHDLVALEQELNMLRANLQDLAPAGQRARVNCMGT